MIFSLQHNHIGKYHLIPEDGGKEICGTAGTFLYTAFNYLELDNGTFYTTDHILGKQLLPDHLLKLEYCKKCIKKALKSLSNANPSMHPHTVR